MESEGVGKDKVQKESPNSQTFQISHKKPLLVSSVTSTNEPTQHQSTLEISLSDLIQSL